MSDNQQPSTPPEVGEVNEDDVRIADMSHGQPRCDECLGANLVAVVTRGGQHVLKCQDCGTLNRLGPA